MKRPKMLSATFVKTVKQSGRFGDGRGGHGLSLLVKPASTGRLSKSWAQRLRIGSKAVNMGLGSYPITTLAKARTAALENAQAVADGLDPRRGGIPTFSDAAERTIAMHREAWKPSSRANTEQQWRGAIERYCIPNLGAKRIDQIGTADVLDIIGPIWSEKAETARQVKQRLSAIFRWSVAAGFRSDNPAGDAITGALPKARATVRHQRALPHAEVGEAVAQIRAADTYRGTRLALEFLILTAARSGEVRGAVWSEIDLEARTWTVSADRMKAGKEHRVPLSDGALHVLKLAKALKQSGNLVFPSLRGKVLTDATVSKVLRKNEIAAVPHGFRSSFRDWAAESGQAHDVAEAALAHTNGNRTEAAYNRSDLHQRRRALMQDWSDYLKNQGGE